jgi:uncharacterized membrane protein
LPETTHDRHGRLDRAGFWFVFLWFFVGGIAHFVFTEAEMRIVPPWLPSPRMLVWVSGVCELAGALGLLWPRTRRWAAWGLFALTVAVTPANVYMLQQAELFPGVPYGMLVARLPLQLLLLALIARIGFLPRPSGERAGVRGARR